MPNLLDRTKRRARTSHNGRFTKANLIISACVVLAGLAILLTHAATPAASLEPENGNTNTATTVSDSNASNGKYVKFGASTGVPAACANGGTYLWANLATCGWPDASNTGPVASQCPGGVLTNTGSSLSGVITISASNTSYTCKNVTGCLYVTGANINITNVKITCDSGLKGINVDNTSSPAGHGAIMIEDGASATITNIEIDAHKGTHSCIEHQGTSMTVTKLNCYNADDGVFSWADTSFSQTTGDNFTIQDSYFHDFTTQTSNGHIDGYQTEGAANGMIQHNTFLMTTDDINNLSDSAIAIWNSLKNSHDITVQNNLMNGGGATVYAEDYSPSESDNSGGFTSTNIFFTNNSFSTTLAGSNHPCVGFGPGWDGVVWFRVGPTDGWHRSGNKVLETGENIDNSNPHFPGGGLCT